MIKINYHKLITKKLKIQFSNHHICQKHSKINHFMSNNAIKFASPEKVGKILLLSGLTYNTSRHFAHCSNFSLSLLAWKNTTQYTKYPHILCVKPSQKV